MFQKLLSLFCFHRSGRKCQYRSDTDTEYRIGAPLQSTNTLMRVSCHVGAKLLIFNRMLKMDHKNKVLPIFFFTQSELQNTTTKVIHPKEQIT